MIPKIELTENLVNLTCCPISLCPLVNAQRLSCKPGDTFSLESILPMFGEMINGKCEKPNSCPLCRERVTAYFPNPLVQNFVNEILGEHKGPDHMNKMYEIIRKLKIDFDKGECFPLKKIEYRLQRHSFSKSILNFQLEEKEKSEQVQIMRSWSFNIEKTSFGYLQRMYIFFNDNDYGSKESLSNYISKNHINFFAENSHHSCLDLLLPSENFIKLLNLLIQSSELDDQTGNILKKFFDIYETLVLEEKTDA